jgi:hypothetical protein
VDKDTVAMEMASGLLPRWGSEYSKVEMLMEDAFLAADTFIERAKQDTKVEHSTQPAILELAGRWCDAESLPMDLRREVILFAKWAAQEQQAGTLA